MPIFNAANIKLWSRLGQRAVFGSVAAPELAQNDQNILFLAADVASSAGLSRLKDSMPERLLNMGIAEQNMIGVAAGLASVGFTPFACSFAPFITSRVADQARLCMGYMRLPVILVSLASGLAMGINGPSHLGFEDVGIMRAIPGITVVCPADATETIKACAALAELRSPAYLRLAGSANSPIIYDGDYVFQLGKAIILREGADVAIISNGPMLDIAMKAAVLLEAQQIGALVINMHTLNPLDEEALAKAAATRLMITMEEHGIIGGLGSAVAEYLAPLGKKPPLLALGLEDFPHARAYDQLLAACGFTPEAVAARIVLALGQL